jgi:hypothetical protein
MTKIKWFLLFRDIVVIDSENHKVHINVIILCGESAELLNVKAAGTNKLKLRFEVKKYVYEYAITLFYVYLLLIKFLIKSQM